MYHFIIRDLPLKLEQFLATWRGEDTRQYLKSTNLLFQYMYNTCVIINIHVRSIPHLLAHAHLIS